MVMGSQSRVWSGPYYWALTIPWSRLLAFVCEVAFHNVNVHRNPKRRAMFSCGISHVSNNILADVVSILQLYSATAMFRHSPPSLAPGSNKIIIIIIIFLAGTKIVTPRPWPAANRWFCDLISWEPASLPLWPPHPHSGWMNGDYGFWIKWVNTDEFFIRNKEDVAGACWY